MGFLSIYSSLIISFMEKLITLLLKSISHLPFGCLYLFADIFSFILYYLIGYRKKVVRNNLMSSFPEKSSREILTIEKQFYRFLGDLFVESIKLFHISDSELKKRIKVTNYEIVNESLNQSKNAVILMGHFGNWEWIQEISRYLNPTAYMASVYQPPASKLWDNIFIKMRSRWNAHILPSKQMLHSLLNRENFPWACGLIADQRPGYKTDNNSIKFLNHKTYFFYLSEDLGQKVGADFFYLEMIRKKRGYYEIILHKLIPSQSNISYPHVREFWKEFEKTIQKNPAYWLWSHKRWK